MKNNFLIKDLTGKIRNGKQYIRVAIRDEKMNIQFKEVLKKIII